MIKRWCINSLGIQAWWGRKRQVHGYHPPYSIQDEWLATDDQKNNILGSLSSYLAENWLQKLEIKHCAYYTEVISVCLCVCVCVYVCVCVCVVSQFSLSITKQNYLLVRCQSLSHIPDTSLRYSNQPSWKLNLMTGVNTTKQQTGEIENTI